MDHQHIEDRQIISLYLMGKLSPDELALFEQHLVECSECLDQLELTRGLRTGLQRLAQEDDQVFRPSFQGPLGWLASWSAPQQSALLAAVLLLAITPIVLLTIRAAQIRHELEDQTKTSAELKERYVAEQQTRKNMETQLAQARPQLSMALMYSLPLTRGADNAEDATRVYLPKEGAQQIVLSPEFVPAREFQSYRGQLTGAEGKVVWSDEHILPSPAGGFAISVPRSLLPPGNYLLSLEGLTRSGRYVRAAGYHFKVSIQR